MTETLGERIGRALEAADMTVKDLEAELAEAGVDGGSYANLHRLKSDKLARPSAGLLHGIATTTGVRLAWLVAGEGPRTEADAEAAAKVDNRAREVESDPEWERDVRFKWEVLSALGVSPPDPEDMEPGPLRTDEDGRILREDFIRAMDAWARSVNAGQVPYWVPPLLQVRRRLGVDGEALGRALRGPLDALELDADAMTRENLESYITAMTPALLTLDQQETS